MANESRSNLFSFFATLAALALVVVCTLGATRSMADFFTSTASGSGGPMDLEAELHALDDPATDALWQSTYR